MGSLRNAELDVVCVGGGLAGAALARRMAARGYQVLVLERSERSQDRVRGEATHPWGTAEARLLGLYDLMMQASGMEVARTDECLAPGPARPRDNVSTTAFRLPRLTFSHPDMQEALLAAAADAGATVLRNVRVRSIEAGAAGRLAAVAYESGKQKTEVRTRILVGADGRASCVRAWAGFELRRDPPALLMAGTLIEGAPVEAGVSYAMIHPQKGRKVILLPRGDGRVRAYLAWHVATGARRLQGERDFGQFVNEVLAMGAPATQMAGARQAGPLATFECNECWVEHPYANGVALVGDAAAASDPTWGQGLALSMRDVRVLTDALMAHEDWETAGHAYAAEHDRAYGVLHAVNNWYAELLMDPSPAGEAKRKRALPRIAEEPARVPLHQYCGPELEAGEAVRRRFFGED
jgi:2-polyprenyl-6-methoxyphenol hydroxylase-like FAD-dependent oxidoreductase